MHSGSITALVLAGGRSSRMGGEEKGMQLFQGVPLARHALRRLQQTHSPLIATCAINANQHLEKYAHWGVPVWPDTVAGQPGPLAGVLTGLRRCATSHLLTLPCDTPNFPLDLIDRLAQGLAHADTTVTVACAHDELGILRRQPVFTLVPASLANHLEAFMSQGGQKVGQWLSQHRTLDVAFDQPSAFENINTLEHLKELEMRSMW